MESDSSGSEEKNSDLGAFKLKDETSLKPPIQIGSFFKRRREDKPESETDLTKKTKHDNLLANTKKVSSTMSSNLSTSTRHSFSNHKAPTSPTTQSLSTSQAALKQFSQNNSGSDDKSQQSPLPLDAVMRGVVFVLSGFQNPERGQLRDKAVSMGASYRKDWTRDCTHLVCAFPNTPKYREVNGKGEIVSKDWVTECHRQKKMLPCRRFRLGKATSDGVSYGNDDDEEEEEENSGDDSFIVDDDEVEYEDDNSSYSSSDEDDTPKSDKPKSKKSKKDTKHPEKSSPLSQPTKSLSQPTKPSSPQPSTSFSSSSSCIYDDLLSTSVKLPSFFSNKKFFAYGLFSASEIKFFTRYITAYGGHLSDYMTDDITAVLSNHEWDENFDEALQDNPKLIFLKPEWLVECINKQDLIPFRKGFLVKKIK